MTHNEATANKYLPYDVLINIPTQILQARDPEQIRTAQDARLVHDALLFTLMVTMPCLRSKEIREARIHGAANIFKGPLNPFADITVPEWAADELRRDPSAELWQIHFSRMETKGRAFCAVLPQNLILMLEEYLPQHRPLLVGDNDPGTLFVGTGRCGGPLDVRQLTALIGNLTARFANCRIVPAWIRLAFAFSWLDDNPHDYYTLSRVLGHADVRSTIRQFGTRLSVSGAMRKVEKWAKGRKAKSENSSKGHKA